MKFKHKIIRKSRKEVKHHNVNTLDSFFISVFTYGGFIAGGYARFALSEKPFAEPKDIDVFCEGKDDFANLHEWLSGLGHIVFDSPFAASFKITKGFPYINKKVQLIRPREEGNVKTFGTPEEVIDNFDFTINMVAFDHEGFCMAKDFQNHNKRNKLVFNNIHCAVGILTRVRKYLRKGYKITISELLKIYYMWDEVSKEDKELIRNTFNDSWFDESDDEETINKKYQKKILDNKQVFQIFYVD
jgi:hypothetical protein